MSKLIPDPQIQSLRAMRAGDISFANGGTITIGKQSVAVRSPEGVVNESVDAIPSVEAVLGPFNDNPPVGVVDAFTLSEDAAVSISPSSVPSIETLVGLFSESPAIGVGIGTSVI